MKRHSPAILAAALLIAPAALSAEKGTLRAGAARLDITPASDAALPMAGYSARVEGHKGTRDPLFVRALVLDDGSAQAAIVSFDLIGIPEAFWTKMSTRLSAETGIPKEHLLIIGTHTHGGPAVANVKDEFLPRWQPWMATLEERTVEAVRQARAALQPARFGAGTGKAYVSTNRRARMASGAWGLGVNPEGPSDKTVAVVRFETAAGQPVAILMNYAVHGTVTGQGNLQISGDLPGAASRWVEEHYGNNVVALFTSGAAGDQNAIYGPGTNFGQVDILGRMLGEEVVRVAGGIRASPRARLLAAQRIVTCPGRRMTPESRPSAGKVEFADADQVNIRLSLLMINHIALAGVSGEVLTNIGQRLKRESPFANTLMTTHTNGSVGYLPDDASYQQVSYEIWVSRVKPGCAEQGIVNGLLEMMDRY